YGYLVKPFQPATLLSTTAIAISNFQRIKKGLNLGKLSVKLTNQEKRMCELLVTGKSYQQMADELFVSINTVRYHIKNLYIKFSVNSRAELVSKLIK
ncbi:MAG: LuxR C-terminal-related transcriptional regulator, partial [Bacteroidota bacterium]